MADRLQSKQLFLDRTREALNDPVQTRAATKQVPLPKDLADWLSRLRLLKGVPFQYLVPDEAMLPPESIRFFTLDQTWVERLTDGALSVGRTLTRNPQAMLSGIEQAASGHALPRAHAAIPLRRAENLGTPPAATPSGTISGFLLRSDVIAANPGLAVNVFPKGHTPADHDKDPSIEINLLDILRFETLGPQSSVLLCLVSGDAYRVDIHQPPEGLHYGIDKYDGLTSPVTADKNVHKFTVVDGTVTLSPDWETVSIGRSFRPGNQRVVSMTALAGEIAKTNDRTAIDAAEMGFEMTQGVGMVSFIKEYSQ